MFRFLHKTLDVITLFHKASSPASLRVHAVLKQASANASAHATEDQASNAAAKSQPKPQGFELEVTEDPPTEDQLQSILEYIGAHRAGDVISGAKSEPDALKRLQLNRDSFRRPLTVDWRNGRAVAGDNESEILKMINSSKVNSASRLRYNPSLVLRRR